ncbi:gas vesicle protein [Priestia filamentosa]|uniref:gas vesicle protein n=1 Tax=Priestia TaxID=2800373 RepID=UPI001FB31364|nr:MULTISPECIES: gas vesicle protein [Priestia]MCY8230387.1 gas vesicle protein [Priestia endophytica]MED3726721.1 gas vesicle protein [Priestia filamentosa]UOE60088.1 gas vesicle protein [Priestia filamentosa]
MNEEVTVEDRHQEVTLLDILDVILDKGIALRGELVISIADIDLVYLDLRVLVVAVEKMMTLSTNTIEGSAEEYGST